MSLSKTRLRGSDEGRAPLIYAASQREEDESHFALLGRVFRFTASHFSGHLTCLGTQRAGVDRENPQLCFCRRCATLDELQQEWKFVGKWTTHDKLSRGICAVSCYVCLVCGSLPVAPSILAAGAKLKLSQTQNTKLPLFAFAYRCIQGPRGHYAVYTMSFYGWLTTTTTAMKVILIIELFQHFQDSQQKWTHSDCSEKWDETWRWLCTGVISQNSGYQHRKGYSFFMFYFFIIAFVLMFVPIQKHLLSVSGMLIIEEKLGLTEYRGEMYDVKYSHCTYCNLPWEQTGSQ